MVHVMMYGEQVVGKHTLITQLPEPLDYQNKLYVSYICGSDHRDSTAVPIEIQNFFDLLYHLL